MKGLPKKKGRVGAANIKGMSIEYGPAKKIYTVPLMRRSAEYTTRRRTPGFDNIWSPPTDLERSLFVSRTVV